MTTLQSATLEVARKKPRDEPKVERNQKFGRWVILESGFRSKKHVPCRCECGTERDVLIGNLLSGLSTSCGCGTADASSKRMTTHGLSRSSEYSSWLNAKARCHNPDHPGYPRWGGRGVAMCERWKSSFPNFLADMGPKPSPSHSIDRIDGGRGYEPGNCRWATAKQQSENRPSWVTNLTHNGETMTVSEWAKKIGISREALRDRLRTGWTVSEALTTPKGRAR